MSSFNKGLRMGAGVFTFGYGVYRLAQGKRDWTTTASITTGASLMLSDVGAVQNTMGNAMGSVAGMARMAMRVLT